MTIADSSPPEIAPFDDDISFFGLYHGFLITEDIIKLHHKVLCSRYVEWIMNGLLFKQLYIIQYIYHFKENYEKTEPKDIIQYVDYSIDKAGSSFDEKEYNIIILQPTLAYQY